MSIDNYMAIGLLAVLAVSYIPTMRGYSRTYLWALLAAWASANLEASRLRDKKQSALRKQVLDYIGWQPSTD
jgi:hypothetical protein